MCIYKKRLCVKVEVRTATGLGACFEIQIFLLDNFIENQET